MERAIREGPIAREMRNKKEFQPIVENAIGVFRDYIAKSEAQLNTAL